MSKLQIVNEVSWGCQYMLLCINEIKCIEFDYNPSFIRIYYLDKFISGFTENNFNFSKFFTDIKTNSECAICIYQSLEKKYEFLGEEENEE